MHSDVAKIDDVFLYRWVSWGILENRSVDGNEASWVASTPLWPCQWLRSLSLPLINIYFHFHFHQPVINITDSHFPRWSLGCLMCLPVLVYSFWRVVRSAHCKKNKQTRLHDPLFSCKCENCGIDSLNCRHNQIHNINNPIKVIPIYSKASPDFYVH